MGYYAGDNVEEWKRNHIHATKSCSKEVLKSVIAEISNNKVQGFSDKELLKIYKKELILKTLKGTK